MDDKDYEKFESEIFAISEDIVLVWLIRDVEIKDFRDDEVGAILETARKFFCYAALEERGLIVCCYPRRAGEVIE